jgi:hypothetical protein
MIGIVFAEPGEAKRFFKLVSTKAIQKGMFLLSRLIHRLTPMSYESETSG